MSRSNLKSCYYGEVSEHFELWEMPSDTVKYCISLSEPLIGYLDWLKKVDSKGIRKHKEELQEWLKKHKEWKIEWYSM